MHFIPKYIAWQLLNNRRTGKGATKLRHLGSWDTVKQFPFSSLFRSNILKYYKTKYCVTGEYRSHNNQHVQTSLSGVV